jgi:hypothetical protein
MISLYDTQWGNFNKFTKFAKFVKMARVQRVEMKGNSPFSPNVHKKFFL